MWKTLSEDEARELISRSNFAHLGCVLEKDTPYVVPVNYVLRDGAVYIHSLEGTKLDALRKKRKACVQVEDIRSPFNWKSAIAFGTFEELPDGGERSEVLQDLLELFRTMTPVEGLEAERGSAEVPVVFRIKVDRFTGVSES
jgi:nitroimidazol reductase NimA-like FMN-containing flavoprotein (pyridoxamine 5'-phosphate oxidase superfamily)